METPSPSGRHARWRTRVYGSGARSIKIIYRPGKPNANADALLQCPVAVAPQEGIGESEFQVAAIQSERQAEKTFSELLVTDTASVVPESFAVEQHKDGELLEIVH